MSREQIIAIREDIHDYIRRKTAETGESYSHVCMAVTQAVLRYEIEESEKHLKEVGFK